MLNMLILLNKTLLYCGRTMNVLFELRNLWWNYDSFFRVFEIVKKNQATLNLVTFSSSLFILLLKISNYPTPWIRHWFSYFVN